MRHFLLGQVVFFAIAQLPGITFGAVCGSDSAKPSTMGRFVTPAPRPPSPYFYYRLGEYVVLASPAVIQAQLGLLANASPRSAAAVVSSKIRSMMPLKGDSDLYSLILHDPDLWFTTQSLIVEAIESGGASVIDAGGNLLDKIYVEHDQRSSSVTTAIRLDKSTKSVELIRRLECIVD